ncbi:hypothetical protein DY000_02031253 [Brassica cretica]|uniref:DUF287 domain-containing protein n=1 Tax=Brassica cretica TaxID=69181 RepID=A0ABQ7DI86_BRACR|nr:hypothetical protein DY000_02031253 [Brassica cretica]
MSIADEWREATTAEELRGVWTARSREETKPDKRPRLTPAEKKEGVINSVLVPTVGEEIMLARIINEPEYHCEGSTSDTWNHWLNVKHMKIFWKELYELDVVARVFEKKKDKEKVTFLEDSSSNSGLESLKAPEEKLRKKGFWGQ